MPNTTDPQPIGDLAAKILADVAIRRWGSIEGMQTRLYFLIQKPNPDHLDLCEQALLSRLIDDRMIFEERAET